MNNPRSRRLIHWAATAGLLAGTCGFRTAPPDTAASQTAPATREAATQEAGDGSTVVVTAVAGKARARTGPTAEFQPVTVGMRLPVGAEINTGPRGRVTCVIPPGEEFVVDRMSTVTVLEAERRGGRQRTRLVMEYGRTAARVQEAGIEHDMQIQTPATTAAVRGTEYTVYDQPPFAPELRTYSGLVNYRYAKRQMSVGKGGRARGGQGSAETALLQSVIDPSTPRARTNADAALIANEVSRGAVLTYNPAIQLNEIRGGAGPSTDAALVNSLPGKLNFVIRWRQNVDVDIFVTVQPGDPLGTILAGTFNPETILFPGFGLETAPSGGRIPFNHRGGRNGGQEICFWPDAFPTAVYGFSAINNSTSQPVDVRFNAFLDGDKLSLYTFAEDGTLVRGKGFQRTLAPDGFDSTIALVPPVQLLEDALPEEPDQTLDGTLPQGSSQGSLKAGKPSKSSKSAKGSKQPKASPSNRRGATTVVAPRPAPAPVRKR